MKYLKGLVVVLLLLDVSTTFAEAERDTTFRQEPIPIISQPGIYYIKIVRISIGGSTIFELLDPVRVRIHDPFELAHYRRNRGNLDGLKYWRVFSFHGWKSYDYQAVDKQGENIIAPQMLGLFERGQPISFELYTRVSGGSADTFFPKNRDLCQFEPYVDRQEMGYYFICDDGIFYDGDMDLEFKIYTELPL